MEKPIIPTYIRNSFIGAGVLLTTIAGFTYSSGGVEPQAHAVLDQGSSQTSNTEANGTISETGSDEVSEDSSEPGPGLTEEDIRNLEEMNRKPADYPTVPATADGNQTAEPGEVQTPAESSPTPDNMIDTTSPAPAPTTPQQDTTSTPQQKPSPEVKTTPKQETKPAPKPTHEKKPKAQKKETSKPKPQNQSKTYKSKPAPSKPSSATGSSSSNVKSNPGDKKTDNKNHGESIWKGSGSGEIVVKFTITEGSSAEITYTMVSDGKETEKTVKLDKNYVREVVIPYDGDSSELFLTVSSSDKTSVSYSIANSKISPKKD